MNANESAYPVLHSYEGVTDTSPGLTKREIIAAMCLQGLVACPDISGSFAVIACDAIGYADALLAQLAKEQK